MTLGGKTQIRGNFDIGISGIGQHIFSQADLLAQDEIFDRDSLTLMK